MSTVLPIKLADSEMTSVPVDMLGLTTHFAASSIGYAEDGTFSHYNLPEEYFPAEDGDGHSTYVNDMNIDKPGVRAALAGLCVNTRTYNSLVSFAQAIDNIKGTVGVAGKSGLSSTSPYWKTHFKATPVSELVGTGQYYPLFEEIDTWINKLCSQQTVATVLYDGTPQQYYERRGWINAPVALKMTIADMCRLYLNHASSESIVSLFTSIRLAIIGSCVNNVVYNQSADKMEVTYSLSFTEWYQNHSSVEGVQQIVRDIVLTWIREVSDEGKVATIGDVTFQHIEENGLYDRLFGEGDTKPIDMNYPGDEPGTLSPDTEMDWRSDPAADDTKNIPDGDKPTLPGFEESALVVEIPKYETSFEPTQCPGSENDATCLTNVGQLGLISQAGEKTQMCAFFTLDAKSKKKKYSLKDLKAELGSQVSSELAEAQIPKYQSGMDGIEYILTQTANALLPQSAIDACVEQELFYYETVDLGKGKTSKQAFIVVRNMPEADLSALDNIAFANSEQFIDSFNAPDMYTAALRTGPQVPLIIPTSSIQKKEKKGEETRWKLVFTKKPAVFCSLLAYRVSDRWYDPYQGNELFKTEYDHNWEAYMKRVQSDDDPDDPEAPKKFPWWTIPLVAIPTVAMIIVAVLNRNKNKNNPKRVTTTGLTDEPAASKQVVINL